MRSAAASCLLVLIAATSASAIVTYQDGTFSNANWVIETTSIGGGGTGSGVQVSGVGTPGEARRVTSSVNAPAGSAILQFHRYGTSQATRYDPAVLGEIGDVSFDIDARMVSGFGDGQGLTIALKQGQLVYAGPGMATGSSGVWVHRSLRGLSASDFTRIDGQPGEPDFSATGLPIRFGFVTSHATTGGAYSIVVDYDNFLVRVAPPCAADFNRDGGIDGGDVSAFFEAWESGSAAADVNLDGGVDGSDVGAFFAVWESGGC